METILLFDKQFFYLINTTLANPLFDLIMPFITNFNNFKILVLILIILLLIFGKKKGREALLMTIITYLFAGNLSDDILKEAFGRIRPCNELDNVRLLVNCSHSFSFPSSHAVNIFTVATVCSYYYRKIRWFLFIFASLVAYSRVYVGVHYPLDVITGAFWGISMAKIFLYLKNIYSHQTSKMVKKLTIKTYYENEEFDNQDTKK